MTAAIEHTVDMMIEGIERQINELAVQRRELTGQLANAADFRERSELQDRINALGEQGKKLEAERRRLNARARVAPAKAKNGVTMPPPKFKLYQRVGRNSVQAESQPAVSLSTTQMSFNDRAFEAMGVSIGDSLSLLFCEETGTIALKKPPKNWSAAKSSKIQQSTGAPAGALQGMAAFLKWAGIDPKAAKGIYTLEHDEDLGHWQFRLPAGSWAKPG